jgi:phosphoribosyl 1,2-cyclic phosphodiesterase
LLVEAGGCRVLLDTPPEISQLLDQAGVFDLTAVVLSHEHFDNISVQNVIALMQDWSLQRAVITHINHDNLTHAELVEKVAPYDITVAYDGQTMEI